MVPLGPWACFRLQRPAREPDSPRSDPRAASQIRIREVAFRLVEQARPGEGPVRGSAEASSTSSSRLFGASSILVTFDVGRCARLPHGAE
jgi:hypothetical protein